MISAALQAANALALLRLEAAAELMEAGVPEECIAFTTSGAIRVCGKLAWSAVWSWYPSEVPRLEMHPAWHCYGRGRAGASVNDWVRQNKALWESVKEAV